MELRRTIEAKFGPHPFGDALFYAMPGGLRFELSEGGAPLDEALTALRKATAICSDMFAGAESITVGLREYKWKGRSLFDVRSTLRALGPLGISIPREREIWAVPARDDPDDGHVQVAFTVPVAKLQNLLWCAVIRDLGSLMPNPGCSVFLVNVATGLMAHPYDDRGMDLVGPNHLRMRELYIEHNRLLLDYDRAAMDATFAAPPINQHHS